MDYERNDPDELLRVIKSEEKSLKRGKLKIFFGYAAGVGKTYAMLKSAGELKENGVDVVAGYIEPHARPETTALLKGLEILPPKKISYKNITLNEFDLDAALKRHPKVILVDELAHTNAQGMRHTKRYKDIEELLNAGIDVYTTVNVQHIESLNDLVASITGIVVRERIPDSVFDNADFVSLVDIEPKDLLLRLKSGKVYKPQQTEKAVDNFFTEDNLTALREIAMRRLADRVNAISEKARIKTKGDYYTDEHILVCLSSSPSNPKLIRTASRMAVAFKCRFTALFVETTDFQNMSKDNKDRLRDNINLAKQLGATIETVYGDDIPLQIAEFARISGVSKIVIGRSQARKRLFGKPTLTERLIDLSPRLDIHVIPDNKSGEYKKPKQENKLIVFSGADILKSVAMLTLASIIGVIFDVLGFTEVNIITVYILSVLITSVITENRIYSLLSSIVSVFVFNFLFTEPRYTLLAYDSGYPVTFVVMFIAAFITGSLAGKLKNHALQSAKSAYRTNILLETNQLFSRAKGEKEIFSVAAKQLIKLLDTDIIIYPVKNDRLLSAIGYPKNESIPEEYFSENEKAVASWVMKNNKHAGATTDTLPDSKCLYLSIRVNDFVYGVVGIAIKDNIPDSFENGIILSILGECALALENERIDWEKKQAEINVKNEQLRSNLLRAISHDLRTPLTSISGNAGNLISNGNAISEEEKQRLYSDIYDDSMWLINLVENLLSITRIEGGQVQLNITAELCEDVVDEALKHINRYSSEHTIKTCHKTEFLLAKMDSRLIVQVLINLVDNAIKHTDKGSVIEIITEKKGNNAVFTVRDNGKGVNPSDKEHIFDMFYSGTKRIADSKRSLGLGLALCKSVVEAHNGKITLTDNIPHGAVFTFTLPAEEVNLHE